MKFSQEVAHGIYVSWRSLVYNFLSMDIMANFEMSYGYKSVVIYIKYSPHPTIDDIKIRAAYTFF